MQKANGQLRVPSRSRWIKRNAIQQCARFIPQAWLPDSAGPCFVVGCPRSGSSLFDQLLGSHPQIAAYPSEAIDLWHPQAYPWHVACKKHGVPPIWADARAFTDFSLSHRSPQQERLIQKSFAFCRTLSGRAKFVQKCTLIGLMLDYVIRLFPKATFIHILRDGRATALSWAKRQAAHIRAYPRVYQQVGWEVADAALLRYCAAAWRDIVNAIDQSVRELSLDATRFIELKYEDLCANPMPVLQTTAQFLRVDQNGFDRELCEAIQSQNFKFSTELAEADRRDLDQIMGETLRRKGYDPGN